MTPFVQVTESELRALMGLPHRECMVYLAVKFLTRNGWTTNRRQLENLTGLGKRHTQLVLAALERKGLLKRKFVGHPKHPPSRFSAQVGSPGDQSTAISGDRSAAISDDRSAGVQSDRGRSFHTFQGSDLTRSKTDPSVRPSRACAREAKSDDGRTDGRFEPLTELARELWPDVAKPGQFVARLLELAPYAPLEKLTSYLRHGAQTVQADIPLAVLCTRERWEAWQRRRRSTRAQRVPEPRSDTLSPAELAELASRQLRH